MYNSQNLPLEKKKIVKKTISALSIFLFLWIMGGFIVVSIFIAFKIEKWFLLLLIFVGSNLIVAIWAYIYQYIYFKNYYYNFEEDKAEIKKGVVAMATGHVRYARIQNVFVDQDFWDRIFGLYDVHYETAGEISGFYSHVDGLNKINADKLVEFLNHKTNNQKNEVKNEIQTEKQEDVVAQNVKDDDSRIFTRENIPIEKRIIFKTLPGSLIWYYSIILIYSVNILFREVVPTFFEFISSIYTITFYVIIPAIIIIWSYVYYSIWYKNFYFKFDQESGTIKQGVVSTSDVHVYYNRIQNIDISQVAVERIMGICCLVIETASAGTEISGIIIPGLKKENAEKLKNFLLEKSRKHQTI